jgi:hypothetical protein
MRRKEQKEVHHGIPVNAGGVLAISLGLRLTDHRPLSSDFPARWPKLESLEPQLRVLPQLA